MSPERPPVSIVIPSRDTRDLLSACLATLRGAEPEPEIVVVDDASTDGTAEALAALPGVTVLRNPTPQGFTRSVNRGLAVAQGQILLLLNSDTEVLPGALEALCRAFADDARLGAAGAALAYPDGRPQWSGGAFPTPRWLFALASGVGPLIGRLPLYRRARPIVHGGEVDWATGAALAIRREAFEQIGPLDEGYRFYAQDLDYGWRLRRAGWRIAVVSAAKILHHHGATISRDAGASSTRQHPELLYSDLVRFAGVSGGPAAAERARRALRAGVAVRTLGRALARPFLASGERARAQADDEAFRRAFHALAREPCSAGDATAGSCETPRAETESGRSAADAPSTERQPPRGTRA